MRRRKAAPHVRRGAGRRSPRRLRGDAPWRPLGTRAAGPCPVVVAAGRRSPGTEQGTEEVPWCTLRPAAVEEQAVPAPVLDGPFHGPGAGGGRHSWRGGQL